MNKKIVIGLVVIIIAVGVGYFFSQSSHSPSPVEAQPQQTQAAVDYHDNIYLSHTDTAHGTFMTDFAGVTLYTYDKDTAGVSNCTGACADTWKPYTSGAVAQGTFPSNVSVITRADGSKQFTWKSMPLYYYNGDQNVGDTTGDGKGGVWHIVKM